MNPSTRFALTLLVSLTIAARSEAQAPDRPPTSRLNVRPAAPARPALRYALLPAQADLRPGNAAPLYLTATILAARARAASGTEADSLDRYLDAPAPELTRDRAADALLAAFGSALHQLDLAARRDACRWDFPVREDGMNMLLPHLSELRTLARLLSLRARLQIADGRYDAAVDTLRTGFAMSRHLNEQAVLVQSVYSAAVAAVMLERTQELIASRGSPNLYWALSALPQPFVDSQRAMQWERSLLDFAWPDLARAARGELPPEQWQVMWKAVRAIRGLPPGGDAADVLSIARLYPRAKQDLVTSGVAAERVEALPVAYVLGAYYYRRYEEKSDDLWKAFGLPYWQGAGVIARAEREWDRDEQADGHNPLTAFLPAVGVSRLQLAQVDRSVAALRVVEAVRAYAAAHDGRPPESLDDVKELPLPFDPVSGRQFGYEVTPDGAVIVAPAAAGRPQSGLRLEISITK